MKNKKVILSVLAGIVIAGAIIAWLMLSGDKPITVKPGDGVTAQINASLKNSMVKREKDGKKLFPANFFHSTIRHCLKSVLKGT